MTRNLTVTWLKPEVICGKLCEVLTEEVFPVEGLQDAKSLHGVLIIEFMNGRVWSIPIARLVSSHMDPSPSLEKGT